MAKLVASRKTEFSRISDILRHVQRGDNHGLPRPARWGRRDRRALRDPDRPRDELATDGRPRLRHPHAPPGTDDGGRTVRVASVQPRYALGSLAPADHRW